VKAHIFLAVGVAGLDGDGARDRARHGDARVALPHQSPQVALTSSRTVRAVTARRR